MKLTTEQLKIINSTGDIKINAVAGSGKTTTIIEYAETRPRTSKILYLAFNKSVKLEAQNKFNAKGLQNVTVETAHSLAYKHIVFQYQYKVCSQGYKTSQLVKLLNLKGNGEKHTEYVIANHINKFLTYFCNSDKEKVQDLNYLDIVSDAKAKAFVTIFYKYIEQQTRLFLSKMNSGEIEITHDFYLKKFQLSNPTLPYDYILFDEGQDASPAMLNVFMKQKATKVIVGDAHQQIYNWRHAINSLEKVNFKTYHLSTSFRFSQDIANLAMRVLDWKKYIRKDVKTSITGEGATDRGVKSKAILARTNLGLLLKAIEYVMERKKVKSLYFEGNINSYTYAEDGTSLYDVLNLYNGKRRLIEDSLIKEMRDLEELKDYIEKTEDVQLGMLVEIVEEYGNKIPSIIKKIKEKHIDNNDKSNADIIFSTVHRCKGMEYDAIQIINDFISEERLKKLKEENNIHLNTSKLNEEINLLYVAITRTRKSVHIPETLMPILFPNSPLIHVMKVENKEEQKVESTRTNIGSTANKPTKQEESAEKTYSVEEIRKTHKGAYMPWTEELDDELTVMYCEGVNVKDIANHFGRSRGAINSRIKKLELEELYG